MSRSHLALAVVFAALALEVPSADAEEVILDAVQDTYIRSASSQRNNNFDFDTNAEGKVVQADGWIGVFQFDLSSLGGATITGAVMQGYLFEDPANDFNSTNFNQNAYLVETNPADSFYDAGIEDATLTFNTYVGDGWSAAEAQMDSLGVYVQAMGETPNEYKTWGSASANDLVKLNGRASLSNLNQRYALFSLDSDDGSRWWDDHEAGNPIQLVLTVVPNLELQVNPLTGLTRMANDSGESKAINYYRIEGPANSLDPDAWNSLDEQDLDAIGGGAGQSWHESGGSNSELLSESFLLGTTVLDDGEVVGLGAAYNTTLDAGNIEFYYGNTADGGLKQGTVLYVLPGDMNNDGMVDEDDVPAFVQALTNRAAYDANDYGVDADFVGDFDGNGILDAGDINGFSAEIQNAGESQARSVPEPATGLLALLAVASLVGLRKTFTTR